MLKDRRVSEVDRIRRAYQHYEVSRRSLWAAANQGNRMILAERQSATGRLLRDAGLLPLIGRRILDVGCGTGGNLSSLETLGATRDDLFGVDLLPERVAAGRSLYPGINLICSNAEELPFPNGHFALILVGMLFSSILDPVMASNVAREIDRVLQYSGVVIWYDFRYNSPWNREVRGVPESRIRALFPSFDVQLQTLTLLPPVARRLGKLTTLVYPLVSQIQPLRTHYLGLFRKSSVSR
jgi:SAM-dependent methyltransferase